MTHTTVFRIPAILLVLSLFLTWASTPLSAQQLMGDFDGDGYRTQADVNLLTASGNLAEGFSTSTAFDLDQNGKANIVDLQIWLELGTVNPDPGHDNGGTIMGDTNLDGVVSREDESIILESFGSSADHYTKGDIDGSGEVDAIDLLIYFRAFFSGLRNGG
ncbi:MAG: hypothetical protein AAF456_06360 [Planctomycetota bacterium]